MYIKYNSIYVRIERVTHNAGWKLDRDMTFIDNLKIYNISDHVEKSN